MRLIDADELKKSVVHMFCVGGYVKREMIACIEAAPTIEERKRGRWVLSESEFDGHYCSACGTFTVYTATLEEYMPDFCPYCGADMKSE